MSRQLKGKIYQEQRNIKDKSLLGKKLERNSEENITNDISVPNENNSDQGKSNDIIENDYIICVNSTKNIKKEILENITRKYGKLKEIVIDKKAGFITFSREKSAKKMMEDKSSIYANYGIEIDYKRNKIEKIGKEENESINLEESDEEEQSLIDEKKTNKEKRRNEKKSKKEDKIKENNETSEERNEIKISNLKDFPDNSKDIKDEFSKKLKNLTESVNMVLNRDNTLNNNMKIIIEENKTLKDRIGNMESKIDEINRKNKEEHNKLMKLIGVICEVNTQNEKYIGSINFRLELVLNSYKVLYIRKLANLLLDQLFNKKKEYFKNRTITVNEKDHTFTICIKSIKGIDKDIITLIVDFLKYVRFRTSQIIHIQDEEIKFQKEILFECLDISSSSQEESLPLKEVSSLIFENSEKKNREMKGERKKIYKNIKKIIQNEINQIQEEEEEETENSIDDDAQESTENDEERIKKILKGDDKSIKANLKYQLNLLLKKLKINQLELGKEFEEVKKVDGNFLYNSWVSSFEKEDFKKNYVFLKYVKINKRTSLSNMGFYVNEILDGFFINFNEKDPNQIEKKIKKKKSRKKSKYFQPSA